MSFNPMMTLLARVVVDHLEANPTVVELGNQTFRPDDKALRRVIEVSQGRPEFDGEGLSSLLHLSPEERSDKTAFYYRCLGFSDYQAIDVNETYGSLVMDLNRDLQQAYGFSRTFSLVTNNGTGEHIFDQASVLRNMHALTKQGGLMLHLVPFVNYINHGFYCYHPNLFHAIAAANGYQIVALGLGNRLGHGAIATPAPEDEAAAPVLHTERRVALRTLLADPKLPGRGAGRRIKYWCRRILSTSNPGQRFGAVLGWLQRSHHNVLVFAVLRKVSGEPFRVPIQGIYADAISSADLRADYDPARSATAAE